MKRKIVSLSALALAVLIAALTAVSCAEEKPPEDITTPAAVASADQGPVETTEPVDPAYVSDVADMDLGGRTVSFLVEGTNFSADEFKADEIDGNIVHDAVYSRNSLVGKSLGVNFDVTVESNSSVYNVGDKIRNLVKSGDHRYDIITMPGYTHTSYATEGDFHNLVEIDNLDLSKHYWTQGFNEIMCNGKQQYVTTGAYSLSMIRNMYITLYSKSALSERNLPDIYDLTLAGDWTVGKQLELIKGMYNDSNGDSKRDDGDYYGFVSGTNTSCDPYWVGFNLPILQLNRDSGEYFIEIDSDRMVSILETIHNLITKNEDTWNKGGSGGDVDGAYATNSIMKFAEGGCAMTTTMIYRIEVNLTAAGYDGEYGIAPIPKLDSNQDGYRTHTQDQLTVMAVPSTLGASDKGDIGAVMDKIAYYSYKEVFPAYYENALSYRYLQDVGSKIMLDLIYDSLKIEGCFIYSSYFAILGQLRSIVTGDVFTSKVVSMQTKAWPAKVQKLNEDLAKVYS